MTSLAIVILAAQTLSGADFPTLAPKELAARLAGPASAKPVVLHVGFSVLYRSKHIPGTEYAGPGAQPQGLENLKTAVAKVARDREIVLYCGCCPWDKCPNIRPAMALLRSLGFTRVKALYTPTNFAKDWIDLGYPVELGPLAEPAH
jgi:hypothetical protein